MRKPVSNFLILFLFLISPCKGSDEVTVNGAIKDSGTYEIEAGETLWPILRKSNISDFAVISSIFVSRRVDHEIVNYRINLKKLIEKSLDFRLESGDKIFVPRRGDALPDLKGKAVLVE